MPVANDRKLILKDKRLLSYAEYGEPGGRAVIALHGMPGSRIEMQAFDRPAQAAGVRIIAPERPGYGLSDPLRATCFADYTRDVAELADGLGLEHFGLLAVSGGGPYGLACAACLALRLTAAVVVSGIGPLRRAGSMAGMARPNRILFSLGRLSPGLVGFLLPQMLRSSLPGMERQVKAGTSPSPSLSPEMFAIVAADQAEAIRTGGRGIGYDMHNLWQPWGFELADIKMKVTVCHGEADDLAPTALAREVAARLPDCQAHFYPGEGHAEAWLNHDREILQELVSSA